MSNLCVNYDSGRYASNTEWNSNIVVDMKSIQLVAMFGFLLTVVDFIYAPFEYQHQSIELSPQGQAKVPVALSTPPSSHLSSM